MPSWNAILQEIQAYVAANADDPDKARRAFDVVRRRYLKALSDHTNRNTIAYYSGFLSKPNIGGLDINDEDKNGFMLAVHEMDRKKGLDLILHTPGGGIWETQSIVDYLHKMFRNDIRAIVPQIAMSAGTMIACSCKSIVMGKHSNVGPIDPQLRGVPAYGVIREFRRAYKEVKKDPAMGFNWRQIISQYRPTFLSQCENSITWSNSFVREQLAAVMFDGQPQANDEARRIVRQLVSYSANKTHSRHIHADECEAMGLKIEHLEETGKDRFQDLVLTVHHCFMHTLMNTGAYKIIENQEGVAFVKQMRIQSIVQPPAGP